MRVGELATIPHAGMQAYLDVLVAKGRATTARTVGQSLQQVLRWCDRQSIDPLQATARELDAFQSWLVTTYRTPRGQPLARSTVATCLANIKAWYAWLDQRSEIPCNPAHGLFVRVVRSRVVVREHLTLQEATALIASQADAVTRAQRGTYTWAVHLRNLAAICVGIASGRRVGGLRSLHVAHVDLERAEIRVEREKGRTGRVLPIAGWAVTVLRTYLTEARPLLVGTHVVPWLWCAREVDGPISRDALTWALEGAVARTIAANPDLTDLPRKTITWHSLRVSFATLLFSNGCPIRSVNELMLHRCLSTTARYTPIPIEDMQAVWRTAHPRP